MNITVEYYCTNDELIGCMLKCLQSFVYDCYYSTNNNRMNNNSRVDSGSTSTHGIILFKNTANLICCYVQRRLLNNIDYVGIIARIIIYRMLLLNHYLDVFD